MWKRRIGSYGLRLLLVLGLLAPARMVQAVAGVAEPFAAYYEQHEGVRVLGYPLSDLLTTDGYPAQFFEKGRIEDHRSEQGGSGWAFMYGRLTAELMERDPEGLVNASSVSYATLREKHDARYRHPAPTGFKGGIKEREEGVFVPYHSTLGPAPGYLVPWLFWRYMSRQELFPGGWLHDFGLPMTDAFLSETLKDGKPRSIIVQAFERTVLTYDPHNPSEWQVERGNLGIDALRTQNVAGPIELPAPGAWATLPLHVLARVGRPGERLSVTLRWQDGTALSMPFTTLRGEAGQGLLIGTINWLNEGGPPPTPTQWAALEITNQRGVVLARQGVFLLALDDPGTQIIQLAWVLGEEVIPMQRSIPRPVRIGTAALEHLLWGPSPPNLAGFETAIPLPAQVLAYPGREADWGPRVRLLGLTIDTQGVATANFSQELRAYGGGSLRVMLIRQQIRQTLLQFPSVKTVRIAIEGETEGVLEP